MKTAIIVNPSSGGGRTAKMWNETREEVKKRTDGLEEFVTSKAFDATRFASQISQDETKLLIIAGGDGTINEALNGLFDESGNLINPELQIAILSTGRGCDFIKSARISSEYAKALDLISNPTPHKVDVGQAYFKDEFGREQIRYFMNIATAGLGGLVAKRANQAPRFLHPQFTYFGTVAASFLTFSGQIMKITVDGKLFYDGLCLNAFVANGQYSGAGMRWAPHAKLNDGLFDVVVSEPQPKYQLMISGHRMYDGTFITMPGVHHIQGQEVKIETHDDVYIEMDGEQPGVAPALFKIKPQVLNLICQIEQ